jgi:ABC-type transport system substrate-binding protein
MRRLRRPQGQAVLRTQRLRPSLALFLAVLLTPVLAGCFAAGGADDSTGGRDAGSRLRVALAFPPAEGLSPYGADATILSRLGVTEGLTALDANGAAAPALAASWRRENDRTWLFTLREATFQDGSAVTPAAAAAALTHATEAKPAPAALARTATPPRGYSPTSGTDSAWTRGRSTSWPGGSAGCGAATRDSHGSPAARSRPTCSKPSVSPCC